MSDLQSKAWPKTTVVVVNWNGEKFLGQCIAALVAQTVLPHEIIVLDNASTDSSLDIVRQFPSVRLLAQDVNTGFARGNNLAIAAAAADSDWVALLNPDAFAQPEWLEKLLLAAQKNLEFSVYGSKLLNAGSPQLLDGLGDVYHISGLTWRAGHGVDASALQDTEAAREIFSPCAAAALYRRSALQEVGGFDEDYFCYVEDVDLGFRLRLAGYKCMYVPDSVVHHVGSGTTGGKASPFSTYHGHRNLVWTFFKNLPGALFWLLLPVHLALNVVSLIWFVFHGQGLNILHAKRDAVKGLPKMWRKRRDIQKNRVATASQIWRVLDKRLSLLRRK